MKNIVLNKINKIIERIPSDRVYAVGPNSKLTYGELTVCINKFSNKYDFLCNSKCALQCDERFSLAMYLPCIEKLASVVFLQPDDIKKEVLEHFYQTAGIQYVINVINGDIEIEKLDVKPIDSIEYPNIDTQWLLATSGTTGTPKLLSYSLLALCATSKSDIDKGKEFVWGLCYDLNRFAGLQVYFQAVSSGSTLVIAESNYSITETVQLFSNNDVNAMSATPSFWRKILMSSISRDLRLKRITLGGEISEQSILNALKIKFPDSVIVHIYASTEAGVGFVVKDGKSGFPENYLNSYEGSSIQMKVIDEHLWIKSSRGAADILEGTLDVDLDGYVDSGDIVFVRDGRVLFLGRSSGAINVGGSKVIPEEVENVLNSSDYIVLSKVFGKESSMLGMLVSAEIQLSSKANDLNKKEIKSLIISHCKKYLDTYKVPAMMKFVNEISVNQTGKIERK
jgi:acyl-CoA synthetase (AMP-forming)/AMP-acid ligase II